MRVTPILDEAERRRRAEFMCEARAAARQGISPNERTQQREEKADQWAAWFRQRMDTSRCPDPNAFLPDAFARLQQLAEDHTLAAVRELKASLTEALK